MARAISMVGAPSSIGIRPYDDGMMRHLNRSPAVLRERGLISRLAADDLGDVAPPLYQDFVRPPNGMGAISRVGMAATAAPPCTVNESTAPVTTRSAPSAAIW